MQNRRANGEDAAAVPRQRRVLIVAPSPLMVGGQAIHAARLIEGLRDESTVSIDLLPIDPRAPKPLRWLQRIKYLRTLVTWPLYVLSLLARIPRYDIIHVTSAANFSFLLAPTPAILIGKLFGKHVILNYHAGQAQQHLRDWRRTAIPTIRLADETIVQSQYLVDVFTQYGLNARAIFNHVDTERFNFRERQPLKPNILSSRNLEPEYGVDVILRAFALIQERFPEASLTVVGDGSQRETLRTLAADLDLKRVTFTGFESPDRMPGLYDAADICLNASTIDNMPLTILESFAAGLPVVTTNAGGIPYIVTNEETGLVVEQNDPEALANSTIRLLEDAALASRIVRQARAACSRYTWTAVRAQWIQLYKDIDERKPTAQVN